MLQNPLKKIVELQKQGKNGEGGDPVDGEEE